MLNILLRTVIIYLVILFIIRVMGKGELSKMDPFQMVILFMIAELASLPIESPDLSVLTGVTALLSLLLLQVIFSLISLKSQWFKKLVNGKASIIWDKGKINELEMSRLRISIDDLAEQLRLKNYPSFADLDYAILEANGDMSVIPKSGKNPVTRDDMGLLFGDESLPLILVADGVLCRSNLNRSKKDEAHIKNQMSLQGITDYSQIFLCFSDENGALHIYPKAKNKMKQKDSNDGKQGWDLE